MAIEDRNESKVGEEDAYIKSTQTVETEDGQYKRVSIFDGEGLVAGVEYEETDSLSLDKENEEAYVRDSEGNFHEVGYGDFVKVHNYIAGEDDSMKSVERELSGSKTAETFK